jgi:dTDP-4-dehydrorhamnose 3,5-epimerase
MTYLVDEYYDGADELGIRWDDPGLGIDWGLQGAPTVSERDAKNPLIEAIAPAQRPR